MGVVSGLLGSVGRLRGALASVALVTAVVAAVITTLAGSFASAQSFDENRYYQQCLLFEARGDLENAKFACLNALQVRPGFADADLALARVELALGEIASAQTRLRRVQNVITDAWPMVLLAEAALETDRVVDAEGYLRQARSRLIDRANRELEGRVNLTAGRISEKRGEYAQAFDHYAAAIAADSLDVNFRLADARLKLRLGEAAAAERQLVDYMSLTGDDRNASVRSLLGMAQWAQGNTTGATGNLEVAHQLRGSRDVVAQSRDLRSLGLIYYSEGDLQAGNLAMRESFRRENLLSFVAGNAIIWLLLLLVVVGAHLVGESRIASSNSLEVFDGPRLWSVGQVYGILIAAVLIALLAAIFYGVIRYENPLVLLTPSQGSDARALFLLTMSVLLALLVSRRVQGNGFEPLEKLLGESKKPMIGIGWGLVMLGLMLAYLHYRPMNGILGGFYLDLLQLTPFVVAALILLPLIELFFRAFLIPPLAKRYDGTIATVISGSLYALVLGTPVAILFLFGLLLGDAFRRRRSGLETLLAQLTLHVGLVVAVLVSPWAKSLFF